MLTFWLIGALVLISAALVRAMIAVGALDHPGARSSHTRPTPKGGGVGIAAAFFLGCLYWFVAGHRTDLPAGQFAGFMVAAAGIAVVSYLDDLRDYPFRIKLTAQIAAALLVAGCGTRLSVVTLPGIGAIDCGIAGGPLTVAWLLFVTNAVNFIDGLNGLAAGSIAITAIFLAGLGAMSGASFLVCASVALAAGLAGFLPYNYPRARIFMGDVGSQFCGFAIGVLGVVAANRVASPAGVLAVPAVLSGVFIDVVFTLLRRARAGETLTQAHRGHLYQLAQRSFLPDWAVTLLYWSMAGWGAVCDTRIGMPGSTGGIVPLMAVVAPQIVWLSLVVTQARKAGLLDAWRPGG